MSRRPSNSTRTDTRFPYTTHFRSTGDYLSRMDSDGDGHISLVEYQDWMSYAFDGMDRHRDGTLTPDELPGGKRSEEHTSELQSLMRISYAVFCLKKKNILS